MRLLRSLADRRRPGSLSAWFRRRRSHHLAALLASVPRPYSILDIGGASVFWADFPLPGDVQVTLLNVEGAEEAGRFRSIRGDARSLTGFADQSVDVVVSNSVIEHVGTLADQQAMASEIRRVARRYYVQTPNRRFIIDPHYLIPFFHFLPRRAMAAWLARFDAGWLSSTHGDTSAALGLVDSIRLLDARELRQLFPGAAIWRERVLGASKSLIAYHGF